MSIDHECPSPSVIDPGEVGEVNARWTCPVCDKEWIGRFVTGGAGEMKGLGWST